MHATDVPADPLAALDREELKQLGTYAKERLEWTSRRLDEHRAAARQIVTTTGFMLALELTFLGLFVQRMPLKSPSVAFSLEWFVVIGGSLLLGMVMHIWLLVLGIRVAYVVGTPYFPDKPWPSRKLWKLFEAIMGMDLSQPDLKRPASAQELLPQRAHGDGESLDRLLLKSYMEAFPSFQEAEASTAWYLGHLAICFRASFWFLLLALLLLSLYAALSVLGF